MQQWEVVAGVIDPDYCGEVDVVLRNHGDAPVVIERGQRIAQVICISALEVTPAEDGGLRKRQTERGSRGFGSTDAPSVK